ncbi:MAG: rod shape-determining protein RodA [Verrucomicrobiota bacterium]
MAAGFRLTWWEYALERLRRINILLALLCAGLLILGVLFIHGAGQQMGGKYAVLWKRQIFWICMGLIAHAGIILVNLRTLGRYSWIVYSGATLLLASVLVFGTEINNARSWLSLGPFTIQPSELMKPAAIVTLAWAASRPGIRMQRGDRILLLAALTAIPVGLIARQPDHGTALVFLPIAGVMLFLGGLRWKWIGVAALLVALAAPVGYQFALAPHQRERIRTFLDPSADIRNTGWNAHQSMLAVGSGGFSGKGYMQGTQYVLGYLPQTVAPTDFIFSVIAEETGFVGASALLACFFGVILCCLRAAAVSSSSFGAYAAAGVAALVAIHVYVNLGMTVRVAPIIGIPLPLVSYGGSFMLGTMISLGLVQNVCITRRLDQEQ